MGAKIAGRTELGRYIHHASLDSSRKGVHMTESKRYFTGKPCEVGHVADRLVSNRSCVECSRIRKLAWAANNRPKIAVQRRNRHAANPDRLRVYDSDRYRSDPRLKMLAKAKQRAAEKNLEFNLTLNDITIPALCPLLGVSLTIGTGVMYVATSLSSVT
jgi:hypothetical protein